MKKRASGLLFGTTASVAIYAQSAGSFVTSMHWSPYPGASGFILSFGYANSAPGVYFTNYTVTNGAAVSFSFTGQPNMAYRSSIRAFSTDGRISAPTADVVWTNPPLLGPVTGYQPAVIVYVP